MHTPPPRRSCFTPYGPPPATSLATSNPHPPRVPTPASGRLTAQRLKRRRCPRRGSGSSPLRFRLRRSDSAGPALRITLGRQTESHALGRGGEGRGKADREGRWKRDGCARTSVLASVPASAAGAAGIFKLRVKEGGGRKGRKGKQAPSFTENGISPLPTR